MHTLKLLGGASIEGPDGPLGGAIAQRQRLAFLAILALAPTGLVSRDRLLALLWSDLDSARARRALSNALYVIKKELGEEAVSAVGDDLRLGPGAVSVDVAEFLDAVEGGDLEAAVDLYSGPFLDGVHVKDAPEFERWLDGERDRLHGVFMEALEGLAERTREWGKAKEAAERYKQLAAHDPLNTRIALALMSAMAAAGDRAGAIQHAQIHGALLREELGVEADPKVVELAETLRREGPRIAEAEVPPAVVAPSDADPTPAPSGPASLAPAPGTHSAPAFLQRMTRHKLAQWGLAYLASAWLLIQLLDVLADPWGLSAGLQRAVTVVLAVGFFLTLVLVWYHGEKGRQQVTGTELLMVAALMAIGGGLLGLLKDNPGTAIPAAEETRGADGVLLASRDRPSVAVLPFGHFSSDSSDAYFTDGMHDEIITQLSKVSGLAVISRTSVMGYRDTDLTMPEIARELGVAAILEGSVTKVGDQVRITAQLIDGITDEHLWAESFRKTLDLSVANLFVVQAEIAQNVADALRTVLTSDEQRRIAAVPTDSLLAYDLYLRGRREYLAYSPRGNEAAIDLFKQATTLDPAFAQGWAGLADAYSQRAHRFGYPGLWFDSAEVASRRAIALNNEVAEGWKALGLVFTVRGWVGQAMEAYFRALELNPNGHDALNNLGMAFHERGDYVRALQLLREAIRVEPTRAGAWSNIGVLSAELGLFEESRVWLSEARRISPDDPAIITGQLNLPWARGDLQEGLRMATREATLRPNDPGRHLMAAVAAGFARDPEMAMEFLEDAIALVGPEAVDPVLAGAVYAHAGEDEMAGPYFEKALRNGLAFVERGAEGPVVRRNIAMVHAARGNTEDALSWLGRAFESGDRGVFWMEVNPMFDSIRDQPRYAAIIEGMRQDLAEMRQEVLEEGLADPA